MFRIGNCDPSALGVHPGDKAAASAVGESQIQMMTERLCVCGSMLESKHIFIEYKQSWKESPMNPSHFFSTWEDNAARPSDRMSCQRTCFLQIRTFYMIILPRQQLNSMYYGASHLHCSIKLSVEMLMMRHFNSREGIFPDVIYLQGYTVET